MISMQVERIALKVPVRIHGYEFSETHVLVVTLDDGHGIGRGEACGVYYRGETPQGMVAQIEAVRSQLEIGFDAASLQRLLPRGGARNAVDCALWDLEAKRSGRPVYALAEVRPPSALMTTFTLGADEPSRMADAAKRLTSARALKLKLLGDGLDAQRVIAVRRARPTAWLGVDGNQGFSLASLQRLMPILVAARVQLIEQPLPVEADEELEQVSLPITVAADESLQDLDDLARLVDRYDAVNIKLDKCGGLSAGLAIARRAREAGLKPMVGCMAGTSLAMAPAFILGQLCDLVDLDAPISLASDRQPAVFYEDGCIHCPPHLWGGGIP